MKISSVREQYVLLVMSVSFFLPLHANDAETDNNDNKTEVGLYFNLASSATRWHPSLGGSLAADYNVAKYFSIGGELVATSVGVVSLFRDNSSEENQQRRAFNLALGFVPKLLIPFDLGSSKLVPFLGAHIGAGTNILNSVFSMSEYFGWMVGAKYLFASRWGASISYRLQFDARNHGELGTPAYLMFSHGISIGAIYAF